MIDTVPSTTNVSKPLASSGSPPGKARPDHSNFINELSDAMSPAATGDVKADPLPQTGKLQTPNLGVANIVNQLKGTIEFKSVDNLKSFDKRANGDKKPTDAKDPSEIPDEILAQLIDPSSGVNGVAMPIAQKPVQGILVGEHPQKSPNKAIAKNAQADGRQPIADLNLPVQPEARVDPSDNTEISITKMIATTKPASVEATNVSTGEETAKKNDDTPASQTSSNASLVDPFIPILAAPSSTAILSSAAFIPYEHGDPDALKLASAAQRASSNKGNVSPEVVQDGSVPGNEATPAFAPDMQAHLTGTSNKAIPHTGLRADKTDQTAGAAQESSPNPTIAPIQADGNQGLGVPPLPNGELIIGKDQLPKAMQDQISNIGTTDPARPAPRGPIPYAMLPIEVGLSALNGKRSIDVLLSPAELGTVEIRLEVSNNSEVKAHIKADRPETLSMLMNDSYALKSALDQTGMTTTTDSLQFSLRQDGQSPSNSNNPSHQHANRPPRTYEQSDTPNDPAMSDAIPTRPLTRGLGLLDVHI